MFRDILFSRGLITGLVFFVLSVSGSLFYNWHVRRTNEAELRRHDQFLREFETQHKTRPTETVDVPTDTELSRTVSTPDENTDTSMSDESEALPNETENLDFVDAFLPDDLVSEETPTEDIPVSAYGFGPYPELPPEFPEDYWDGISKEHELIARVWMKLLEQGVDVVGGSIQNGLVYPTIRGTIYVEWDWNGRKRYISRMMGDPDTARRIRNLHDPDAYPLQSFTEKDIPADITVVNLPDSGIDPYQFLGLKR